MNTAISRFDMDIVDECNSEQVYELIDYILDMHHSTYTTTYCSTRISIDDAAEVAFTDKSVCDDYFELHPMKPKLIVNHLPVKQLAYHLAFTEPDKATELFNELLYYHTKGRI